MNSKDEEDLFIDNSAIINEKKIKEGENLTLSKIKIISEKGESSICEIIKDNGYGSGFFCKIKYEKKDTYCLITNNHVITRYMLLNKNYIEIKFKNEIKKIFINKYRRIWTDEKIDFTCIEIIEEDNIIEMINPF